MRRLLACACSGVAAMTLFFASAPAAAAVIDAAVSETLLTTVPTGITSMAWAPDDSGRLFLTRRTGEIWIVQDGVLDATPFATVAPVYPNVTETGLLGLDFDPDFSSNGFVYIFVTVSATEQQIVRYTAKGGIGEDPLVIVSGLPTRGRNHNGGGLGFGPDGKLYWAVGDNGNGTGANDDLASLASKVGRAERDGAVPQDNPFVDGDGPNNDYIWARGLRNPFTLTWQPGTDKLWVSVVGTRYEQVFQLEAGDHGGWNDYESTQPDGFVTPSISYPTNGPVPFTITPDGATRSNGVATFRTQTAHRMHPGVRVSVAGVTDASFDGSAVITETPDSRTLSFAQPGPDATSGAGTVSGPDIGGCITGGTFWDSTSVPAQYRGNYFFGDYNSGRIERAQLDAATNRVTSVDHWAQDLVAPIDLAVGPDGDLYYVVFAGALYRARYKATEQGIVISKRHLRLAEGGRTTLGVRLAIRPLGDVMVGVERTDGDADVTVELAALFFDPDTWDLPQWVYLAAAEDPDIADDSATLSLSASGLAVETATARVTDNDQVEDAGTGGEGGASFGGSGEAGSEPLMGGVPGAGGAPDHAAAGDDGVSRGGVADAPDAKRDSRVDGCSCRVVGGGASSAGWWLIAAAIAIGLARRPH
jgi:MYXO-CTERM domain-containing protein